MNQLSYGRNAPAMSNTERQRLFRQRHPGYYKRLHAKRTAAINEGLAIKAALQAVKPMLMLPAPVEQIPGFNALPTMTPIREAVGVERV